MKVFHTSDLHKVEWLDQRFYTADNINYYPSVTTILEVYPKGAGFTQFLKDLGNNSEQVVQRAAEQGTKIHDCLDRMIKGETIEWQDQYTLEEWKMLMRFTEFWETTKPEVFGNELSLVDETLGFGGTIDLICGINGKVWLIDFKTTNGLYTTHELQISAYAKLYEAQTKRKIDNTAILWLKSSTRGTDRTGKKIQGEGWQLKEYENFVESYKTFEYVHQIWKVENPDPKPKNLSYPDKLSINLK